MGDNKRFEVFADFLEQQFPRVRQVADVAGGGGRLALELVMRGFQAVVIDVRQTGLPRRDRKRLRKNAVMGRDPANVRRIRESIANVDLSGFDLIVGLHPDAATEWVVRRGVTAGKAFAVVPCCVMPLDGIRRSLDDWLRYLQSLAPGSRVIELPFGGRNHVIVYNPLWPEAVPQGHHRRHEVESRRSNVTAYTPSEGDIRQSDSAINSSERSSPLLYHTGKEVVVR